MSFWEWVFYLPIQSWTWQNEGLHDASKAALCTCYTHTNRDTDKPFSLWRDWLHRLTGTRIFLTHMFKSTHFLYMFTLTLFLYVLLFHSPSISMAKPLLCLFTFPNLSLSLSLLFLLAVLSWWQDKNQTGTSTLNNTGGCADLHQFFWQVSLPLVFKSALFSHLFDFFFSLNLFVYFSASDFLAPSPRCLSLSGSYIYWLVCLKTCFYEYHFWCLAL